MAFLDKVFVDRTKTVYPNQRPAERKPVFCYRKASFGFRAALKPGTVKTPAAPPIDHSQGLGLFSKLIAGLSALSRAPRWKPGKNNTKLCRNSAVFTQKIRARKKRRRKIAYQSRVEKRFPGKPSIKV